MTLEWIKQRKLMVLAASLLVTLILWGPTIYANLSTRSLRYNLATSSASSLPEKDVAIVFGAGLLSNGEPTPYLHARVATAVKLYKAGRVRKLLMTGDNTRQAYNEPEVMKKLAMKLGVPAKDITADYAGLNTYDSCYRAQAIFAVKDAVVITQGYHLPRAVLACNGLGVSSIGVAAERTGRDFTVSYIVREWVSTVKITFQLIFKPPPTALGNPEPIN